MEQALPALSNDVVSSLRHYTLTKQEVVTSARAAKQLFQAHGAQEAAERCQALVVQLAEDLRSYTLKRDALRRGLLHREEEMRGGVRWSNWLASALRAVAP